MVMMKITVWHDMKSMKQRRVKRSYGVSGINTITMETGQEFWQGKVTMRWRSGMPMMP